MNDRIIYCTNCGRQIVNHNSSNNLYVGSTSIKPTRDVNGFICHECANSEREFYALQEEI